MSRAVTWQRNLSDAVSWNQDQALTSMFYILREVGPTSFLLKEDGHDKKFKISLGNPHFCNCASFKKEKTLCKHICWILLKRFKLDRYNELCYQLGLVEREINQLLKLESQNKFKKKENLQTSNNERKSIQRRNITVDDVCPICQEELLSEYQPVTFCRYGCGNSVHIKCMKVWVEHQTQSGDFVKCPFCREDFSTFVQLNKEYQTTLSDQFKDRFRRNSDGLFSHFGCICKSCEMNPIRGKCYKCVSCDDYFLCNSCFHFGNHSHHDFNFRLRSSQRWRPPVNSREVQDQPHNNPLSDLERREIDSNDYDLLLQLDREATNSSSHIPVDLAGLPEHLVNRLPLSKVQSHSRLLVPGRQCRICLQPYAAGQFLRKLPCGHIFHRDCVDKWLLDDHRCCPIDRKSVLEGLKACGSLYKPSTSTNQREEKQTTPHQDPDSLCIPGVGILNLTPKPPGLPVKKISKKRFSGKTKESRRKQQLRLFDPISNQRIQSDSFLSPSMGNLTLQGSRKTNQVYRGITSVRNQKTSGTSLRPSNRQTKSATQLQSHNSFLPMLHVNGFHLKASATDRNEAYKKP